MRNIRTLTLAMVGSVGMCLAAAGCAAERHSAIPADASLVAKGQTNVTYRAPREGMVYVYDRSTGQMVYSGRVRESDMIAIDAMKDRVLVNNTPVNEKQIKDFDEIKVYFRESPEIRSIEARPASDTTLIREREIRTEPRTETVAPRSDSTITVRPDKDKVTVEGSTDSKVTIEQPNTDSKVTIERGAEQR